MLIYLNDIYLFVIQFIVFIIITSFLYYLLRKKEIIPTILHPYTKKKDRKVLFDFSNGVLFMVFGFVFLINNFWIPSLLLYVLVVMQYHMLYLYIKQQKNEEILLEITYSEEELNEWKEKIKDENEKKTKKKLTKNNKPTKKVVLTNNFIYTGEHKKDQIRINPIFQRNIYLQDIKEENNFVILSYGIFGSPMLKRHIYFPKSKNKLKTKFIKKIKELQNNQK